MPGFVNSCLGTHRLASFHIWSLWFTSSLRNWICPRSSTIMKQSPRRNLSWIYSDISNGKGPNQLFISCTQVYNKKNIHLHKIKINKSKNKIHQMHGQGQQHLDKHCFPKWLGGSLSMLCAYYWWWIQYEYWFPHKVCIQGASQAIHN